MGQKSSALNDDDIQHLKDLAKRIRPDLSTSVARVNEGKLITESIESVCLGFIKSNDLTLAMVGTLAIELLNSAKQGQVKLKNISTSFPEINRDPLLKGALESQGTYLDVKGYIRLPNRAGLLFLEAMKLAYKGQKFSWGDVYSGIPDSEYNRMSVYKSWLKKQYDELDAQNGGALGYSLLCDLRSKLYSKDGIILLSEGYSPAQVEHKLTTGEDKKFTEDELFGEDFIIDFSEKGSNPLYLQDLAKIVIKSK